LENWRSVFQTFKKLEHPTLIVSIGGAVVEKRPSSFSLVTDQGFSSVVAHLKFPAESDIGNTGEPVTVSLSYGDDEHLLFTGEIYSARVHGAYRDLNLVDGYIKLCDTQMVAAYRKEKASVILKDTLDAAGIEETAITCPDVEIARFSTIEIAADMIIIHLIKTLEEHGHYGLKFFFDEKDTFHFGKEKDTGKNEGEVFEFETGKNILKKGDGKIEVLPLPIRHCQLVMVDGKELITHRTDLFVSGSKSRMSLYLKEVE
jgi:hypothetical protein